MFTKLKQALKTAIQRAQPAPVDPAQFEDPVAVQTEWTPAAGGGANFRTQKLIEASPGRLEFRPTLGMKLFTAIFFLVGLGTFIAGAYALVIGFDGERTPAWFLIPFGLIFGAVAAGMHYVSSRPKVFDMDMLWYWKGKQPVDRAEVEQRKDAAPLDVVHAVQLIRELCRGDKSSYYSYEINLVIHDATRINVVDHGKLSAIRQDAQTLAIFIDVPV